jgi:cytochrome P450
VQFVSNLGHLIFPFSGQKFAMLELKSTISQVLRSFKVIESGSKEDLRFTLDFILKSVTGLKVKLHLR